MSPDRVDQMLRRASDDVRATIVRHAVPLPIEALDEPRLAVGRFVLAFAAATVTVTLGLAIVGDRSAPEAPIVDVPTPAVTLPPATPESAGTDALCGRVVSLAGALAAPPGDTDAWSRLGDELDVLAAQLERSRSGLDADSARRYDRFVALAGRSVSLGAQGGFTPAAARADDAVAVGAELVEFVAIPGCELERPRSSDEEEPG